MPDDPKPALELMRYELDYRRKKQWDIFSWAMTLLVASIGGVLALSVKGEFSAPWWQRGAMAAGLAALTLYAVRWTHANLKSEIFAHRALLRMMQAGGVATDDFPPPSDEFDIGYREIVGGVGAIATLVVLCG